MANFDVTVLGSSSATPAYNRNPSAQLLNLNEKFYLIDCGEATQNQLNKFRIKVFKITVDLRCAESQAYIATYCRCSRQKVNSVSPQGFVSKN